MSGQHMKSNRRRKSSTANGKAFELPALPPLLTRPLGLEGWTAYEPVLLAALASEDPLLLIGPHGSAKSFLLERLAQTLGLEYRFYNASLINYDDLVGIPMPDEDRKKLHYISTPSAVWDAEVVFFDEINRTRPELQNKLFPIVHERRVQGVPLTKLRYRWSAMNPPPAADGDDETLEVYLGAEPLDPALADRFAFLVEVPGWQQLTEEEKRRVLRDQFAGSHGFPVPLLDMVSSARSHLESLQSAPPQSLQDYLLALLSQFESNKILLSARRVTILHRNILAVHAARMALYGFAFPKLPSQMADWNTSTLLAVRNSLPQTAQGKPVDPAFLLGSHRQAWAVSRLDADNPWRKLLQISDPLERCTEGLCMGKAVADEHASQLVLDAIAVQPDSASRAAVALAIYGTLHRHRNFRATVFETIAQETRSVLQPGSSSHHPDGCSRGRYRQVKHLCDELLQATDSADSTRNSYAANLLQGCLPDGYETLTPRKVLDLFTKTWDRLAPLADQNYQRPEK